MDEIRALLERLTDLTPEELSALRQQVVDEFQRLDGEDTSPQNTAAMAELADIGDQILAETANREQAQAEAEQGRADASERLQQLRGESQEGEGEDEPEGEPEEGEGEGEGEGAEQEGQQAEAEQTPEPVAASGNVVGRLARRRTPASSPEKRDLDEPRRAVLTATGALQVQDQSKPITDRWELADGMCNTLQRMNRKGPPRGDVIVASACYPYPDDRILSDDAWANTRVLEQITGQQALTASGGTCLPVNVDYAVPTWATADRPLRDGLPAFQAPRGGVRYVQPPDIGAWMAATGIWTEATDAEPGALTKPIVSLKCGTEELVYTMAVSTRLGFGNMQARFAPEQVAANTDLAMAAAARVAENNILALIEATALKNVTNTLTYGATRDLLTVIHKVSATYRQNHRIPRSQSLTAIFPEWVKDLLKVDMAREIGHGEVNGRDPLAVTESEVESLLGNAGINAIWHLDGQGEPASKAYPPQVMTALAEGAVVAPFPAKLAWYFFAEGQIQFLDAGRLDLGVVRDSTLDATNDYETFVETFEGIANRGFAGGVVQLVTSLCASGATAGTIAAEGKCA
jgi:hypothetical protein